MKKVILVLILLFIPISVNAFSSSAKGVVLMDTDSNRVLYSKNPHYVSSVASISKIMTAVVVIENSDIEKEVTIGEEVLKAHGSAIYIKEGEKLKIKDLLYGLMLRSGNDAAVSLATKVGGSVENFVNLMNKKAKEIGMTDTTFHNPSGLDDDEEGNYSSAYDMALLMSYAMQIDAFKEIVQTKYYKLKTNKNVYEWKNKNKLLFTYKYTTGGKTGFTKKARRTLVSSASKDNLNLTVVTINDGNDFKEHVSLYEEAFNTYQNYQILNKGIVSILGETYYKDNELYYKNDFTYPLTESEKEVINLKFKLEKKRNVKNNDKVGEAIIYIGEKKVHSENIYFKDKKTELTFWDKIKNFVLGKS